MKAIHCEQYGPPESLRLRDVERPVPAEGEVLIAVKACGINFPDSLIIQNKYQFRPPLPFAPGGEIAGVVVEVGAGVQDWSVGDEVIAFTIWGGLAEEAIVDAKRLMPKPKGMSFTEAASLLMAYGTALHALEDRAELKAGETLLVLGAAGGVGSAAVQIGRAMGARVIAATSTEEKAAFCRRIGAHDFIDYAADDLRARVREITGGQGLDVVFDPVGGDISNAALRSMAWSGRYLVVGFASGEVQKLPANLILLKGCSVVGVFWGEFIGRGGEDRDGHVARLGSLYSEGHIAPQISDVFSLEQAPTAIRRVMDRQAIGKTVVEVS